jgi:transcription initiation factor TFIIIB Brf1 subunit/transcription initiation factor TFIIB
MGILPKKCPDCGSKHLVMNTDGMICKKCGLVISDNPCLEI